MNKNENIDLDRIVLNTPGYVGADLNALIDEALISSLDRQLNEQITKQNKDALTTDLTRKFVFIILRNIFKYLKKKLNLFNK
jgi:SpoVK/Ycf46/Vps4 family AAA+-type ATPase